MPETVGVRELRRDLSRYLRRVERGETFAVTSRGREVAVLGPARLDPVTRLELERGAVSARLDVLDVEPLELSGGPPLGDTLEDVRGDRL
jgi:prevent-host-death family protein